MSAGISSPEVGRCGEAGQCDPAPLEGPLPKRIPPIIWPMLAAAATMAVGVLLRLRTARYTGAPEQGEFNTFIFGQLGAYSDITSLYIRDQLWNDPVPYLGYPLEYPVGIGLVSWTLTALTDGMMAYFFATAAVLAVAGLLVIWLGRYFAGANLWLLALSPSLALYVVLNWDLLGILPMIGALVLLRRNRDGWGALLLTGAVWMKLFPIVLLPIAVLDRLVKRRWRDAALICGVFGLASAAINAPFALHLTPDGPRPRAAWLYFFHFNEDRAREVNLWNLLDRFGQRFSTAEINAYSMILLLAGCAATLLLVWHASLGNEGRTRDLILVGGLLLLSWWLFINKVYSCQYSLWIAVFAVLARVPTPLIVAFTATDLWYYLARFTEYFLGWSLQADAAVWVNYEILWLATAARELAILVIIGWVGWQLVRWGRGAPMPWSRHLSDAPWPGRWSAARQRLAPQRQAVTTVARDDGHHVPPNYS
jgi:uncharacterized membrane protein